MFPVGHAPGRGQLRAGLQRPLGDPLEGDPLNRVTGQSPPGRHLPDRAPIQSRVWREMQYLIQLLNAHKVATGW